MVISSRGQTAALPIAFHAQQRCGRLRRRRVLVRHAVTRAAAELLGKLLSLRETTVGGRSKIRRSAGCLLLSQESRQRRSLVVGQRENRHAVVAVEPGWVGEPVGEEAGRTFVSDVGKVA